MFAGIDFQIVFYVGLGKLHLSSDLHLYDDVLVYLCMYLLMKMLISRLFNYIIGHTFFHYYYNCNNLL